MENHLETHMLESSPINYVVHFFHIIACFWPLLYVQAPSKLNLICRFSSYL